MKHKADIKKVILLISHYLTRFFKKKGPYNKILNRELENSLFLPFSNP